MRTDQNRADGAAKQRSYEPVAMKWESLGLYVAGGDNMPSSPPLRSDITITFCSLHSTPMSRWWRKAQEAIPKSSTLKKTASSNVSFLEKKYSESSIRKTLERSASDFGKRAKNVPESLRIRSAELGKQARERAEDTTSRLGKRAAESARAIPSKATEAVKNAAKGAAAAGCTATKNIASAGAQSARDAGKRASGKLRDAVPKIGSYATWTGRRVALLLLGTAFLYGLGSSLPGAVARYYVERDRRRDQEERKSGGEQLSSSGRAVGEGGGGGGSVVERSSLTLLEAVERWMGKR